MAAQRLFVVAFFTVGLFLLAGQPVLGQQGDERPNLSSLSDADLKTITVRFQRVGCFGTCPAYSITIHGDGRVEFNGKSHVKEIGAREGRIELDKIRALASDFAKTKFLAIPEDYSPSKCKGPFCTDMATAVTQLTVKGITHHVSHYYG